MSAPSLRIISFNLRGCLAPDSWNIWPLRRALVADLLARHEPDIIGFQEALRPNLRYLRKRLPGHGHERGRAGGSIRLLGVYNPIFFARHGLDLVDSGGFWLSRRPDTYSVSWGGRHARTATWVRLRRGRFSFLLVNLHLDHENANARIGASRLVLQQLGALGWPRVPAVVTGDFNANPDSPEHALWLEAGLLDSWRSAGHRAEDERAYTFHGFTGQRVPGETRIDWILHSPAFHPLRVAILGDARPPRYPSDHFPVLADLAWS